MCCPFTPLKTQKIKILKKWKKKKYCWRYHHFIHVYQKWQSYHVRFLRYGVRQRELFVILGYFLPFYPTSNLPKQKSSWRYYWFTQVISCMVPEKWSMMDRICLNFGPFFTLQQPEKAKFWKNEKKPRDIITLHKCTKKHDYMLHCSWDTRRNRCNIHFSFWAIFCSLPL